MCGQAFRGEDTLRAGKCSSRVQPALNIDLLNLASRCRANWLLGPD